MTSLPSDAVRRLRAAIVVALEAIEIGAPAFAADVLYDALDDVPLPTDVERAT